jgi:hypothetical protein
MTLQHLRSSTANKRPLPGSMSDGQIAINTNTSSPGLFFKDSAGALVKVGPVHVGSTAPNVSPAGGGETGNTVGEQWLDTSGSTYVFKIWDGSAWRSEAGEFVNATGDVMTGALGIIAGSAGSPGLYFSGDTNTGIYSPGADQVAISTNGTGRLFVDDAGRVGINGTPSTVLDVFSTSEFQLGLQARTSSTQTAVGNHPIAGLINTSSASGNGVALRFSIADTSGASRAAAQIGAIATAKTASSVTADIYFAPSAVERMRLDSSGRLGLGTSAPANKLDVFGGVGVSYADGIRFNGNIATVNNAILHHTYTSGRDQLNLAPGGNSPNSAIALQTATGSTVATRVLIDELGRVGIGTTAPSSLLHVEGGTTYINSTNAGGTSTPLQLSNAGSSGTSIVKLAFNNAGITKASINAAVFGNDYLAFNTGSDTERARIDSSGRLLVGTSSGVSAAFVNSSIQAHGITGDASSVTLYRFTTSATAAATPRLVMARSGSDSKDFTVVANGNRLGQFNFVGADGTQFISAASIDCEVDGTPGTNDMPGRLVLSVTLDGASSPTEALRITNDRVVAYNQPAPAAVNATATLTVANLKTGIITSTSAAATDMTLPTGTDTQAGFSGTYDNFTFEWSVINTGPSLVRVLAGTAHTIVGSGSVATGTSGRFASRRTAANTFVTYRLS